MNRKKDSEICYVTGLFVLFILLGVSCSQQKQGSKIEEHKDASIHHKNSVIQELPYNMILLAGGKGYYMLFSGEGQSLFIRYNASATKDSTLKMHKDDFK